MVSYPELSRKATREGFGDALLDLGQQDPNVIGLSADLAGSLKMSKFWDKFPQRFYQCGVAEANMMGVAAGLTIGKKIPFVGTFANFATGRVFDQIRQSIAYSHKNGKICASHAGVTLGEDGATHQILEDIGLMRMLPNLTVINPCDYNQTYQATKAVYERWGPSYVRFGRPKVPNFIPDDTPFEIGKALPLKEGKDVTILATGHLVWEALKAETTLAEAGIDAQVVNIHTIKPLDESFILEAAAKTGSIVTAEEHQMNGGLGDAVAQLLARKRPTRMGMVAVHDRFGESGKPDTLLEKYGLNAEEIHRTVINTLDLTYQQA